VFIQKSLNKVGCLSRKIQYQDKQPSPGKTFGDYRQTEDMDVHKLVPVKAHL